MEAHALVGRIVDISGHTAVADVEVGVTAVRADNTRATVVVRTNDAGEFSIDLPEGPFVRAQAATGIVDLEPIALDIDATGEIVPGETVFVAPFEQGSHIRFAGIV